MAKTSAVQKNLKNQYQILKLEKDLMQELKLHSDLKKCMNLLIG